MPQIWSGRHQRNGNRGWVDRDVIGELPVEPDGGHDHQPGNDAAGEKNARNAGADDVADAEIFGGDGDAEGRAGEPVGAGLGLRGPSLDGVHQEGVDAAEAESPEHAAREGTTALTRDQDVGAGRALRKAEVAVLFDDQLAAQRHHEQDAQPSAQQREREDSPEGEFGAEAEEDQRGNGEHHPGGERFARGAGGLHDVVFEDGGAAERAKDADGQHRDGNRSGNGESRAQADIDGDGAEEQAEERAQDHRADREFLQRFVCRHVGAELAWRCCGTPWTIAHEILPVREIECACCENRALVCPCAGGIMPQSGDGRLGERVPILGSQDEDLEQRKH